MSCLRLCDSASSEEGESAVCSPDQRAARRTVARTPRDRAHIAVSAPSRLRVALGAYCEVLRPVVAVHLLLPNEELREVYAVDRPVVVRSRLGMEAWPLCIVERRRSDSGRGRCESGKVKRCRVNHGAEHGVCNAVMDGAVVNGGVVNGGVVNGGAVNGGAVNGSMQV